MSVALTLNLPRTAPRPFASLESVGDVVTLKTGAAWLRHQQLGPFAFTYSGEHPMVLFLFNLDRDAVVSRECARGSFMLLLPGMSASFEPTGPMEVLAVGYDDPTVAQEPAVATGEAARGLTDAGIRALAHEIRRVLLHEGESAAEYLESLAHSFLIRASRATRLATPPPRRETISPFSLRRIADHIESRLSERITVVELAAIAGLSRAHFSRAFVNATGESPHNFIRSRRLTLVRRRLDEGAEDLALLAAQAGFSSHSHMSTAFRQAFGVTPREHREGLAAQPGLPRPLAVTG
jgi:AraC family transcriptional regulator